MGTTTTPETCAAIYVRRSSKDAEGSERNGRSLKEQERECRERAAQLGLRVVEVYREPEGTSASRYSHRARRQWARALSDLDDGARFRTLVVWAFDRASRRGAQEVGALLDRHSGTDRRLVTLDGIDTSDENDRLNAIIRGELARDESERLSKRVRRARRSARDEGRWQAGQPPYGLQRTADGRLGHCPATYPVARRIADEALAGRSPYLIAKTLNAEGVPSARGTQWRASAIIALLRSPGFAGLSSLRRRYKQDGRERWAAIAEVYLNAEGRTVSVGDGVITEGERALILDRLAGRTTPDGKGRRGAAKRESLLRGLARCPYCDSPMTVSGGADSPKRSYVCGGKAQGRVCVGARALQSLIDPLVEDAFLRRLANADPDDPLVTEVAARWVARTDPDVKVQHDDLRADLAAKTAAVERLLDLVESGGLPRERVAERIQRAEARRLDAEKALAAAGTGGDVNLGPLLDIVQSTEAWDALMIGAKRELLALAIDHVGIDRAGGRGVRFDPRRVAIYWHDGRVSVGGRYVAKRWK